MNVVHIGFPKTATTFLQWEIFPNLQAINYLDYRTCEKVFPELIYRDDYDYNVKKVKSILQPLLTETDNLCSFEALAGAPFIYKGLGRSAIPKRLKELGFDKVIITVRDQVDMIDSLYRQYVIQGGVMRFKDFLNKEEKWNLYVRAFNLDYLNYHKTVTHYFQEFGKSNVLVLRQEDLKSNKKQYIDNILEFVGKKLEVDSHARSTKVNQSLSNLAILALRITNHFIFTSQKPNHLIWNKISTKYVSKVFIAILEPYFFRFFTSRKRFLSDHDTSFIRSYYSESNKVLDELLFED